MLVEQSEKWRVKRDRGGHGTGFLESDGENEEYR